MNRATTAQSWTLALRPEVSPKRETGSWSVALWGYWLLVWVMALGCASHSEKTKKARSALDAGKPRVALSAFNESLGVESAKEVPAELDGEKTLILLDRAMVLQSLEEYELSSRDLQIADKEIEILDFSRTSADSLGKYMFSDSSGPYRAPFYEKLLINTVNMVNYLARGDLSGARVEARRLTVMQNYLADHESEQASLIGPGSYLAGFIFELSGEPNEALRYYDEALKAGEFPSLEPVIARLAKRGSYRTERIEKVLARAGEVPEAESGEADLLIVVQHGRVPEKEAKRLPIGLALTYASGGLSPASHRQANELAAQGLVTWVNFPMMRKPSPVPEAALRIDGKPAALNTALAVDKEAVEAWRSVRGQLVASAITRAVTRVLTGQATKKVVGGTLGTLLSLGAQATMTATDVPDTRSWAALPARIALARTRLPAGSHQIQVAVGGVVAERQVQLEPRGWATINFTSLR